MPALIFLNLLPRIPFSRYLVSLSCTFLLSTNCARCGSWKPKKDMNGEGESRIAHHVASSYRNGRPNEKKTKKLNEIWKRCKHMIMMQCVIQRNEKISNSLFKLALWFKYSTICLWSIFLGRYNDRKARVLDFRFQSLSHTARQIFRCLCTTANSDNDAFAISHERVVAHAVLRTENSNSRGQFHLPTKRLHF